MSLAWEMRLYKSKRTQKESKNAASSSNSNNYPKKHSNMSLTYRMLIVLSQKWRSMIFRWRGRTQIRLSKLRRIWGGRELIWRGRKSSLISVWRLFLRQMKMLSNWVKRFMGLRESLTRLIKRLRWWGMICRWWLRNAKISSWASLVKLLRGFLLCIENWQRRRSISRVVLLVC